MGFISKDFIDKLLERAHIDEVIGKFVDLKRAGANLSAKSPFSSDKTASLMVSPAKNMWKDFSSGKGGNMVSFVMEFKPCSYPDAIEIIAGIYNEIVVYEKLELSEKQKEVIEQKEVLRKVLLSVYELYSKEYQKLDVNHSARLEVEGKRNYDSDIIAEWEIGFAPENFLYDKLEKSGKLKEGIALGLIKSENKYDKYTNRVIYPIRDGRGLLIGFAGRDISGKSKAKWINPDVNDQNILYNKSKVWYGLDKAKFEIRKRLEVFITEGYNDVIAAHRYDLPNTLGSCGTSINELQINEIKKLTTNAVFWMDPDVAGKAAVLKQIPLFIKQGFFTQVITTDFDPDDYCRNYSDIIAISGGLNKIFKTPGIRQDGFALLINEFIKKDYIDLETDLNLQRTILQNELSELDEEKSNLILEKNLAESNFVASDNLLKEITLEFGKKSDEFKKQNQLNVSNKAILESSKSKLKNLSESPEVKKLKVTVADLSARYDIAFLNSEIKRAAGAKDLCKVIVNIEDDATFEIYLNWIQKESKIAKSKIKVWIKELRNEIFEDEVSYTHYELPKNVKIPLAELKTDIEHYGMFMANNQIFFSQEKQTDGKVTFSSMSNFEIEALQHMNDEKFPMKLLRIKNVHNLEKIFDTPSENLNTPQAFDNTVTGHGNFRFDGNRSDLLRLRTWLFDKMGNGRKIDVLGWQPDGKFWCWNNKITTEKGLDIPINEHGIFIINETHYYVPSANQIYKNNSFKYDAQKRFRKIDNPTSFAVFAQKVIEVHRDHAISALLFGIASIFQDVVVDKLGNFPLLFFFGPGSSGKDELAAIVQSFVGIPQIAINLEGNVSTVKAQVREFAQFRNGISQLSEYKRGNPQLDGMLKALWDRRGYKRGNIESHVGTDSIPIESSAILTGNDFPNEEPLILRLIWNEMDKNKFNQEEMKAFDELRDMREKGVSCFSDDLFAQRLHFIENFEREQRSWKGILQELFPDAKSRIVSNLSILATAYTLFKDTIKFPFTQEEMINHFRKGIDQQIRKINSASILNRFWDCFIASLRGTKEQRLQVGYIISVSSDSLFMQWSHTYNKIQLEWITRYKELAPTKQVIKDQLIASGVFIEDVSAHSYSEGRNANRSSATVINLNKLNPDVKNDIIGSVMYQINEGTLWEKKEEAKETKEEEAKESQLAIALNLEENDKFFDS